ncbi:MAG: class I SAM-dependent methyltransferase [Chloroflexi bacterium]|nr:class I SAM-dependent methyltransferase [Chloroflexota bacterium]
MRQNKLQFGWTHALDLLPKGTGLCLDLGAGNGRLKAQIETKGYHYLGLDIAPQGPGVYFGDAHALPLKDCSIESVHTQDVLEHLENPWQAVREIYRVLRPKGLFCGSAAFLQPWHESYFHFSHWGAERILKSAGFSILRMEPGSSVLLTLPHGTIDWLTRKELAQHIARFLFAPLWHGFVAARNTRRWIIGSHRGDASRDPFAGFIGQAPFRLAGSILWLAQKPS